MSNKHHRAGLRYSRLAAHTALQAVLSGNMQAMQDTMYHCMCASCSTTLASRTNIHPCLHHRLLPGHVILDAVLSTTCQAHHLPRLAPMTPTTQKPCTIVSPCKIPGILQRVNMPGAHDNMQNNTHHPACTTPLM